MSFDQFLSGLSVSGGQIVLDSSKLAPALQTQITNGQVTQPVTGTVNFPYPADPAAQHPMNAELSFQAGPPGKLNATLRFIPPQNWSFKSTFPDLPEDFLDDLNDPQKLTGPEFYLTNYAHTVTGAKGSIQLQVGLNFCAQWIPSGALGLAAILMNGAPMLLYGTVGLDETLTPADLQDNQRPWKVSPAVPGFNLQGTLADLKILYAGLTDGSAGIHFYSPLSQTWLNDNPDYVPVLAYSGRLTIPGTTVEFEFDALQAPALPEELVVLGGLHGSGSVVQSVLSAIPGGQNALAVLPDVVQQSLSRLDLQDASVRFLVMEGGFEVSAITVGIDLGATPWPLFENLLALELDSVVITFTSPFDAEMQAITGTLTGKVFLFSSKVEFDVRVGAPDFYVIGRQKADQPISIKDFQFGDLKLPDALDFKIADIEFIAEPGSYYSFAMRLAAGESWKLSSFTVPDLAISISSAGWQIRAGAPSDSQERPVASVLTALAAQVGLPTIDPKTDLPTSLSGLTVGSFSVAYLTTAGDFQLVCTGHIPLDGSKPVEAEISINVLKQRGGGYTKQFGGKLLIPAGPGAPLEFDLNVLLAAQADAFAAVYHDPDGRPIAVDDLVNAVFAMQTSLGVSFSVRDVLLAYRSKPSKLLFALDVGAALSLSQIELPGLPLVQMDPLPPELSLRLAFQWFVATQAFDASDVALVSPLLGGSGLTLPEQGMTSAWALSTTLRIGEESKQLSLPIPAAEQPGASKAPPPASAATRPPAEVIPAAANQAQWVSIQKTFGPLYLAQIGLNYQQGLLIAMLDAALTVGGLSISLDGLTLRTPLAPLQPQFDLNGLGIRYQSGPLEIGGAFLKQVMQDANGRDYTVFAGLAILRAKKLTLSAIGSFASLDGHPSLYIYATLDYPLGGPAFFYVTGLAAGFGYNRSLLPPSIDNLASFPLVEQARRQGGPLALPGGSADVQKTISAQLKSMERHIPPALGEYFLAVGVRFTSFKQVDSFALLIFKFGSRFEIDLLGISTLVAPAPVAGDPVAVNPVAKAELVLKATFLPDEGFLGVLGQLTSNSYVLRPDCHLSGGFAFYSWFSGPHAGDFVFTLGGYHPKFKVPSHYPTVPRLTLDWQVDERLHLKGDAYFALTAHALMAGGHFEATYNSGRLSAWFKASIDLIMCWKPFYYDAEIHVDIGATYTFSVFGYQNTVKVELGAGLHVWGPEFSGTAELHYYLFDWTIEFGPRGPKQIKALDWATFRASFLPPGDENLCGVSVQSGVIRQIKTGGDERWILNPVDFCLVTSSEIPITDDGQEGTSIAPMGVRQNHSRTTHAISFEYDGQPYAQTAQSFTFSRLRKSVPVAMWGPPRFIDEKNRLLDRPDPEGRPLLVPDTLAGFEIRPKDPITAGASTPAIGREGLLVDALQTADAFRWEAPGGFAPVTADDVWAQVDATISGNASTAQRRSDLLAALRFPLPVVDFERPAGENATAEPMLVRPGRVNS